MVMYFTLLLTSTENAQGSGSLLRSSEDALFSMNVYTALKLRIEIYEIYIFVYKMIKSMKELSFGGVRFLCPLKGFKGF